MEGIAARSRAMRITLMLHTRPQQKQTGGRDTPAGRGPHVFNTRVQAVQPGRPQNWNLFSSCHGKSRSSICRTHKETKRVSLLYFTKDQHGRGLAVPKKRGQVSPNQKSRVTNHVAITSRKRQIATLQRVCSAQRHTVRREARWCWRISVLSHAAFFAGASAIAGASA